MARPPNILWLLSDEQRADSTGAYGAAWARTPVLDALARRGTRFTAAYAPAPVCVPARAAMLTGQCCSRLGVFTNADEVPVDAAAYGIVQYPSEFRPWIFAGRFPGGIEETAEMQNVRAALAWLEARRAEAPFFLRVSFNAPHTPVTAPAPFDTLIAFVADHGTHLGDHGFLQKQSMYEASARVPLMLAGPGVPAGRAHAALCSAGSLLPTLLELAGLAPLADCDYPSLADALRNGQLDTGAPVFSEVGYGTWGYRSGERYAMVRHGAWKLAAFKPLDGPACDDAAVMLCNLADDPGERINRAHDPACATVRCELSQLLAARDAACHPVLEIVTS